MSVLRGSSDYRDAVVETAARLGIAERQIEKDYWVTETLRELVRRFDGRFLFKGGTSLSKAYRLVERFSEDIDLLLLSEPGTETEELLDAIALAAGEVCGSEPTTESRKDGLARRMLVNYSELANTRRVRGMLRRIVVEPGVRGGPIPNERRSIEALMAQALGADAEYDDLTAFEIDVLHPARTMVEKLFAVDAIAAKLVADPARRLADTEARHLYDLYFLWDEEKSPALPWLGEGQNLDAVVTDCLEVSKLWYPGAPSEVPAGGFANSRVFTDDELAERLLDGYDRMLDIVCFPGAARPSLDEVRARARSLAGRI